MEMFTTREMKLTRGRKVDRSLVIRRFRGKLIVEKRLQEISIFVGRSVTKTNQ